MSVSEEQVRNALKSVKYPGFSRDIVSFGLVKGDQHRQWRSESAARARDERSERSGRRSRMMPRKSLRGLAGVQSAKVLIDIHAPPAGSGAPRRRDADPGNQTRDRDRERQRRCRQIDRRGKSRGRA